MSLKLSPGEQVIFRGHPSWRAVLGFYTQWLVVTVVIAAVVTLVTRVVDDEVNWPLVGAVLVAGVALTLLGGLLKRITTTYTITDRRLNIKRGLISRQIQETRLERVQNVNFSQSVYQRVMQIGDVDFDTAAGDDYNYIFAGVAEPEDVVHEVNEATRIGAQHAGLGDDEPAREPPAG
ncbi:MAG: PH domain-containing protein [Solirubrobacterales bacterium]